MSLRSILEDVRRMEKKNLAVELLERLLQGKIKAQTRTNGVGTLLSPSWSFLAPEETTVRSLLLMQEAMKRHEELGLNPDGRAGVGLMKAGMKSRGP